MMELSTRLPLGNLLKPKHDGWVRLLAPSGRQGPLTGLGSTVQVGEPGLLKAPSSLCGTGPFGEVQLLSFK